MPTPMLAGNWKMNCLRDEAVALAKAVAEGSADVKGRDVLIAPVFTVLASVAEVLAGSKVYLSGQTLHWEAGGAFTGEVSAAMLKDVGCSHVIIGHSERRAMFGGTDYTVAKKAHAAVEGGLVPIVCVGESLKQREAGATMEVIERQVRGGLCELPAGGFDSLIVAYEPVWAIGTGKTASPEQAEEVHGHIRSVLASLTEADRAADIRILYGGSVKPGNVDELMAQPNVNGALVGGASLKADDFLRIIHYQE